ncbi:glycosyltransferase family 25 protein [Jiella sp. M17.18]|uniref:glycosyltransferase family 25 protein n=1 Tax=Jiella sp. M17.18 TaxID=3234247 RepID=UPI0034DE2EB3
MPVDICYINLDRTEDRRAFMKAQARAHGIALTRFSARDAASLDPDEFSRLSRTWERPITPNEFALFLSHRALWERAAATDGGLVILEDDAVLSPRFAEAVQRLPDGFDLLNFESYGRRKFMARRAAFESPLLSVTQIFREKSGTAGYHVSPAGARKLLALANTRAAPSDAFIYAVARLRIGQVEPALVMQVHLLAERGIDAGITTATSIHQPRRRLGYEAENWPFHRRRLATSLGLVPQHVRRLLDADFRAPRIDLEEFRRVLPVAMPAGEGAASEPAQPSSQSAS